MENINIANADEPNRASSKPADDLDSILNLLGNEGDQTKDDSPAATPEDEPKPDTQDDLGSILDLLGADTSTAQYETSTNANNAPAEATDAANTDSNLDSLLDDLGPKAASVNDQGTGPSSPDSVKENPDEAPAENEDRPLPSASDALDHAWQNRGRIPGEIKRLIVEAPAAFRAAETSARLALLALLAVFSSFVVTTLLLHSSEAEQETLEDLDKAISDIDEDLDKVEAAVNDAMEPAASSAETALDIAQPDTEASAPAAEPSAASSEGADATDRP